MRDKEAKFYGVSNIYFLPRIAHLKLNITYRCDRGCPNCNRVTALCPSSEKEDLQPIQLENMLKECVQENKTWTRITMTGGEPTMHKDFEIFADILMDYKKNHSPACNIGSYTYHHPKYFYRAENVMKKYPDFQLKDTRKDKPRIHKIAYLKAPIDDVDYDPNHIYHGCNEGARLCGENFDYTESFHCCSVGGGIDRIFKMGIGIKGVKNITVPNLIAQYKYLCPKCGMYKYYRADVNKNIISKTWKEAIKKYNLCT